VIADVAKRLETLEHEAFPSLRADAHCPDDSFLDILLKSSGRLGNG